VGLGPMGWLHVDRTTALKEFLRATRQVDLGMLVNVAKSQTSLFLGCSVGVTK
jgi:hypothetical protein